MLNDATGFEKVYLATGRTDLRRGIDVDCQVKLTHFFT